MRQMKISKQFTNRDSRSLDLYLHEISKIPLISENEEVDFARRIRDSDNLALEKLVSANLRFVVSIAKQYQNLGLPLGDLINFGNLGLIKAAKKFDETRGFKFISFAVWWIRQSILQGLANEGSAIRMPQNKISSNGRIANAINKLEQELERNPTDEEIMEFMNIDKENFSYFLVNAKPSSYDAPISADSETSFLDITDNGEPVISDALTNESLKNDIVRILSVVLDKREVSILIDSYGLKDNLKMSNEDIAEKNGMVPERVRQIREKAIRKLRKGPAGKVLKTYL